MAKNHSYNLTMNVRLSNRLKVIYDNLLPNKDVWDVCCDHGYLGVAAYKSRLFSDIYFVDQVPSIMQNLTNRFKKYVHDSSVSTSAFFICEDAAKIKKNMTGTLCISGVGGGTIFDILNSLNKKDLLNTERIILGPHRDNEKLLKLIQTDLYLKKYSYIKEYSVTENNHIRSIYIFNIIQNLTH